VKLRNWVSAGIHEQGVSFSKSQSWPLSYFLPNFRKHRGSEGKGRCPLQGPQETVLREELQLQASVIQSKKKKKKKNPRDKCKYSKSLPA
jgi:hypothetical protein